jgi:hypothetical protein
VSAVPLESALAALGWPCRVDARERLAILIPADADALAATSARREDAVRLARAHGFTHVAVEVPAAPCDDAVLSGD